VLGLVGREAEEDLADELGHQLRRRRRHGAAAGGEGFGGGIDSGENRSKAPSDTHSLLLLLLLSAAGGGDGGGGDAVAAVVAMGRGLGEPEGGQELLESLDDRWGPHQNRGLNRYPCWSWVTILSLHILKIF
jgi:hypothetical protein